MRTVEEVSVLVLAAGASRRFGGPKLLHPLGDRTVIEHALLGVLRAGVGSVTVVTGAYHDRLAPLLERYPVNVVHNPHWEEGMASSLRAGIAALPESPRALIICLGDQPYLPPSVIAALVRAHRETGAPLVAPGVNGVRQNPVLFDGRLIGELREVRGDEGGRSVVRRHAHELLLVPFAEPRWFQDIDRPDDVE